jgi:hypothetical protein
MDNGTTIIVQRSKAKYLLHSFTKAAKHFRKPFHDWMISCDVVVCSVKNIVVMMFRKVCRFVSLNSGVFLRCMTGLDGFD